jgi:SAM-dependent methyltransferase
MMENYEPILSFGEDTAEIYDAEPDAGQRRDTLAAVSFLEQLAGGGPALELAIGTGRVALPLAARGVRVDFSPPMVAKLRAKPGGDQISVTIGDFADVPVQGTTPTLMMGYTCLKLSLQQNWPPST